MAGAEMLKMSMIPKKHEISAELANLRKHKKELTDANLDKLLKKQPQQVSATY